MAARTSLVRPTGTWFGLAITVVLVVVAVLATAGLGQRGAERTPAAAANDDGRFRLGPDQVPSVFGLTADQAVGRLETLGLHASVKTIATCRDLPGRALWTRPGTGGLVTPGADVVVITAAPGARCLIGDLGPDREAAWRFLDFADGRGGPPPLAAEVSVYAGGSRTTLTAVQATDPRAWPGLATITQAVGAVERVGAGRTVGYRTPRLGTRLGTHASCGTRPAELRGRRGLVLWIGVPTDGMGLVGTCTELTLFRDELGAIDAVLVSDTRAPTSLPGPPDVVGNSAAVARDRLEAAGYAVDEVAGPGCGQVGTVSAQTPSWGEDVEPGATVTLGVTDRPVPCQSVPLRPPTPLTRAADALIAFARGEGPAPTTAADVEVYVGDELHTTLTPDTAADRASWAPVLDRLTRAVAQSEGAGAAEDSCLVRGDLPAGLSDESAWRLSVPEPRGCADDWSVLVWVDGADAIRAVDVLTGRSDSRTVER